MKPHPGYRTAWLWLHGLGVVATTVLGRPAWWAYFGLVALFEAVALARKLKGRSADGTWSWVTWAYLLDGATERYPYRVGIVAMWSVWFVVGFARFGWFSPGLNAAVAMLFMLWLWVHFFKVRRARRGRASSPGNRAP